MTYRWFMIVLHLFAISATFLFYNWIDVYPVAFSVQQQLAAWVGTIVGYLARVWLEPRKGHHGISFYNRH